MLKIYNMDLVKCVFAEKLFLNLNDSVALGAPVDC